MQINLIFPLKALFANNFAIANKLGTTMIKTPTPPQQSKYHSIAITESYIIYPESLKKNIFHLANQFGWQRVIWEVPNDFYWYGTVHFPSTSLYDILNKVLINYTIQANFYYRNHILVTTSRDTK